MINFIVIIFLYHSMTEHKIQKLNKYGRQPEKSQLIELAAYANQTKLFFKLMALVVN